MTHELCFSVLVGSALHQFKQELIAEVLLVQNLLQQHVEARTPAEDPDLKAVLERKETSEENYFKCRYFESWSPFFTAKN